jgi:hypothetical protein
MQSFLVPWAFITRLTANDKRIYPEYTWCGLDTLDRCPRRTARQEIIKLEPSTVIGL